MTEQHLLIAYAVKKYVKFVRLSQIVPTEDILPISKKPLTRFELSVEQIETVYLPASSSICVLSVVGIPKTYSGVVNVLQGAPSLFL